MVPVYLAHWVPSQLKVLSQVTIIKTVIKNPSCRHTLLPLSCRAGEEFVISSSEVLAWICVKNYHKRREVIKILLSHHMFFQQALGQVLHTILGTARCKKAPRKHHHFSAKLSAEVRLRLLDVAAQLLCQGRTVQRAPTSWQRQRLDGPKLMGSVGVLHVGSALRKLPTSSTFSRSRLKPGLSSAGQQRQRQEAKGSLYLGFPA